MLCVWSTIVVKWLVIAACQFVDLVHVLFHHIWKCVIPGITCLTALEVCIGILAGGTQNRMLWVQCILTELVQLFPVN